VSSVVIVGGGIVIERDVRGTRSIAAMMSRRRKSTLWRDRGRDLMARLAPSGAAQLRGRFTAAIGGLPPGGLNSAER
jgi:hypothetical protein